MRVNSTLRRILFALSAGSALAGCVYQDPFALPPLESSGGAAHSSPYHYGGSGYYGSGFYGTGRYDDPRVGYYYRPGYPGYDSSYGPRPYPAPGYVPYPRGPYCIDANRDGRCDGQRPHGGGHDQDHDRDDDDGNGPGHGGGSGPGDDGRDHGPRGNATGRSPMEPLRDVARQAEQPAGRARVPAFTPPAGGQAGPRTRPAVDSGRPAVRVEPPPARVRPAPEVADRPSRGDRATVRGDMTVAPPVHD